MDNTAFAHDLHGALTAHWAPGIVNFRGSFATGQIDPYSDIDLTATVYRPLDETFFTTLINLLEDRYGPMSLRFDPEDRNNRQGQEVRFNFHHRPIFHRVDLQIESEKPCPAKYPDPFPEFSLVVSAFWNLVWAVKYAKRNKVADADHYTTAACKKLQRDPLPYSPENIKQLLAIIAADSSADHKLIAMLQTAL